VQALRSAIAPELRALEQEWSSTREELRQEVDEVHREVQQELQRLKKEAWVSKSRKSQLMLLLQQLTWVCNTIL
jgi:hypothetical protein